MPKRRSLALGPLALLLSACATSAAPTPTWELHSPTAIGTPIPAPTLAPTPEPAATEPPIVMETPPPPECPTSLPAQPMLLHQVTAIDPLCFGTTSITLIGWQDAPTDLDWEGPTVVPGWLIYPQASARSALWDARPDKGSCFHSDGCEWTLLHVAPGSKLTFNGTHRWVEVTVHLNDPAAAACHYDYGPDPSQTEFLPDSDAQHWCASSFVLEKVEVTTAP